MVHPWVYGPPVFAMSWCTPLLRRTYWTDHETDCVFAHGLGCRRNPWTSKWTCGALNHIIYTRKVKSDYMELLLRSCALNSLPHHACIFPNPVNQGILTFCRVIDVPIFHDGLWHSPGQDSKQHIALLWHIEQRGWSELAQCCRICLLRGDYPFCCTPVVTIFHTTLEFQDLIYVQPGIAFLVTLFSLLDGYSFSRCQKLLSWADVCINLVSNKITLANAKICLNIIFWV